MNISHCFPTKIYIEDEAVKDFIEKEFGVDKKGLIIGGWFDTKNYAKPTSNNFYVVKPLDTIKSVSKKLNMTEAELIALAKTKKLFIGQKIFLNDWKNCVIIIYSYVYIKKKGNYDNS